MRSPDTGANGWAFSDVPGDGQQATGSPGYLLQGDLLQSLGPFLTARSDTFRVRAYGDKIDRAGNLRARAWCEAIVQRLPEPVEKLTPYSSPEKDLIPGPRRRRGRLSRGWRKALLRAKISHCLLPLAEGVRPVAAGSPERGLEPRQRCGHARKFRVVSPQSLRESGP